MSCSVFPSSDKLQARATIPVKLPRYSSLGAVSDPVYLFSGDIQSLNGASSHLMVCVFPTTLQILECGTANSLSVRDAHSGAKDARHCVTESTWLKGVASVTPLPRSLSAAKATLCIVLLNEGASVARLPASGSCLSTCGRGDQNRPDACPVLFRHCLWSRVLHST